MMFSGIVLMIAASILTARMLVERRPWAQIGFAFMTLAVALSAFRRIIYVPGEVLHQIALDNIVVSIFLVGSLCLGVDAVARAMHESDDEGRRWPAILRKLLGAMVLPACLLFLSATVWAWDGQESKQLTMEQSLRSIRSGMNVPAAVARALDLAEDAVTVAQRVVQSGDAESAGIAARRLDILKEKLK